MLPFPDFKFASDLIKCEWKKSRGEEMKISKGVKGRTTTQCKEAGEEDCTPRLGMAKITMEEYGLEV
jgi:hypothetical protein